MEVLQGINWNFLSEWNKLPLIKKSCHIRSISYLKFKAVGEIYMFKGENLISSLNEFCTSVLL